MKVSKDDSNQSILSITYHGRAVDDGEMDISVLGPALSSLDEFLKVSWQVIDERIKPASIRLRTVRKEESIGLELVVMEIVQQIPLELIDVAVQHVHEVKDGVLELWDLWEENKYQARHIVRTIRKVVSIVRQHTGGMVLRLPQRGERRVSNRRRRETGLVVYYSGGNKIPVKAGIAEIIENREAKYKLLRFLKPVEQDGIDRVVLKSGEDRVEVTGNDVRVYRRLRFRRETTEQRTEEILTVLTLHFQWGKKWRLTGRLGNEFAEFSAEMKDHKFMERVRRHEIEFGYRDQIRVTFGHSVVSQSHHHR